MTRIRIAGWLLRLPLKGKTARWIKGIASRLLSPPEWGIWVNGVPILVRNADPVLGTFDLIKVLDAPEQAQGPDPLNFDKPVILHTLNSPPRGGQPDLN